MAGLWAYWDKIPGHERATFTIITTQGNELLSKIHNNPKLNEPRMPAIIDKKFEETWLSEDLASQDIKELMKPYDSSDMIAYPVRKLRGKNAVGNNKIVIEPYNYEELTTQQGWLF